MTDLFERLKEIVENFENQIPCDETWNELYADLYFLIIEEEDKREEDEESNGSGSEAS